MSLSLRRSHRVLFGYTLKLLSALHATVGTEILQDSFSCSFLFLGAREFYNICSFLELCLKRERERCSQLWCSPNSSEISTILPTLQYVAWGTDSRVQCQKSTSVCFCCFFALALHLLPLQFPGDKAGGKTVFNYLCILPSLLFVLEILAVYTKNIFFLKL